MEPIAAVLGTVVGERVLTSNIKSVIDDINKILQNAGKTIERAIRDISFMKWFIDTYPFPQLFRYEDCCEIDKYFFGKCGTRLRHLNNFKTFCAIPLYLVIKITGDRARMSNFAEIDESYFFTFRPKYKISDGNCVFFDEIVPHDYPQISIKALRCECRRCDVCGKRQDRRMCGNFL